MTRPDSFNRFVAKLIDFTLVGILATFFRSWAGVVAAALYILISDGFFNGQSVGKKLIGLRVVGDPAKGSQPCSFKESMVRNAAYGFVILFGTIPLVGWFIIFPLGVLFWLVEAYFVYSDDEGVRIGDILAATRVVEDAKPTS